MWWLHEGVRVQNPRKAAQKCYSHSNSKLLEPAKNPREEVQHFCDGLAGPQFDWKQRLGSRTNDHLGEGLGLGSSLVKERHEAQEQHWALRLYAPSVKIFKLAPLRCYPQYDPALIDSPHALIGSFVTIPTRSPKPRYAEGSIQR